MSLELEVEVKVAKPLAEEDVEEMDTKRIIGKPLIDVFNLNDENKFEYRKFVIRLDQIEGRGDFDGIHTVIYLPYGAFLVNMPYDKFNFLYESITGVALKRLSDYRFEVKRKNDKG